MRLRVRRSPASPDPGNSVTITELRDGRQVDIFARSRRTFDAAANPLPQGARSYVICFVQRSGSTMLRTILSNTNVLGKPEEFLNPRGVMQRHVDRSGARNLNEYFAYARSTMATSNGLFGIKAAWPDFRPLVDACVVGRLLDPVQFVYLVRGDLLRQSISGVLAQRRNVWHVYADRPPTEIPDAGEPDAALVEEQVRKLIAEQAAWEQFFALHGISPHRISYEQLVADPAGTVLGVAAFLGVELSRDQVPAGGETEPLADEVNERWREAVISRHPL